MANLSNLNNRFIVSDAGHVSIGNVTTNTYLVHAKSSAINNAILALESSSWQSGASAELRLSYVAGHERSIKGGYSTGLEFYTNNATPAISILPGGSASGATGNVGIGTTSPATFLQVSGAGNSSGGNIQMGLSSQGANKWSYLTGTHYNSTTEPEGFALIGGYSDIDENRVVIGGDIWETNPATSIHFWTHSSSTHAQGGTERMRIANTLITFPTVTELRGDIGSNKFAIGNMGDGSSQMMVSSRGFLTFNVSNTGSALDATERMRIDSSGNVGIDAIPETGMVTYVKQLRLGEQSAVQGHADTIGQDSATWLTTNYKFTTSGTVFINGTAAAPGYSNFYQQQLGDHSFGCSPSPGVAGAATGSRIQLMIKQSGNVGIGVTAPNDGRLQVYGNSSSDWGTYIWNQHANGIGLHVETSSYGTEQLLRLSSLTGSGGSNVVRMVVRADGNVGIGNTNPDILGYGNTSRALAVQGIIGTASAQRPVVFNLAGQRDDGTDGYVSDINFLNMASNGTTVNSRAIIRMSRKDADNSNQLEFWTANAGSLPGARMSIRPSGTIGIGSGGFDSQMLTIAAGTLDGAIYATSTDANCFASFRDSSSTANIEYGAIGNAHVFRKDAAEYMRIDGNGNVGIGNTSPYSRLDLNGVLTIGPAELDPSFTVTNTGLSTIAGGSLELVQGFGGTSSSGDTIVFTYKAESWKAFQYEYCISAAYGLSKGGGGGYNNNGMTSYYYVTTNQGSNVNVTSVVSNSGGSSNQYVVVTITGQFGIHPCVSFKYKQSGGDGAPRADRATLAFNS